MIVALATTCRPEYVDRQLATAHRLAHEVIFITHGFVDGRADLSVDGEKKYSEVVNLGLEMAADLAPVVMKIDDHDSYPVYHDPTVHWEPGHSVWGIAQQRACDGANYRRTKSICAGALDTSFRFDPNQEQITPQLLNKPRKVFASEVIKRFCAAEWSWSHTPKARCPHS